MTERRGTNNKRCVVISSVNSAILSLEMLLSVVGILRRNHGVARQGVAKMTPVYIMNIKRHGSIGVR